MSDCCTPKGYQHVFSRENAQAQARRYRRRGLDRISRRIVKLLLEQGVEGRTLLEVGGGIGAIQIELLKAGAARAVSIELTPTYEEAALELLRQAGLEDRVERLVMDFAGAGAEVEAADIVILNRVICCYPDMPRLAGAAAGRARGRIVLSLPNERWWTRLGVAVTNLGCRVGRRQFRVFLHPPDQVLAALAEHELRTVVDQPGLIWQVAALERPAAS